MSGWSTEQDDQLREMWNAGLSASQISRRMEGKSRNAVIGRSSRLGLTGRANPIKRHIAVPKMSDEERRLKHNEQQRVAHAAKRKRTAEPAPPATPRPLKKRGFVYVPGVRSAVPLPAEMVEATVGKFTLEQVQAIHGCRYPYGDLPNMTFCGKPGEPWCEEHRRRVSQPAGRG